MIFNRLRPWRRLAFMLGFGGLGLVLSIAAVLVWGLGREVLMISPHDPEVVALNKSLYDPSETVASIYGNPLSKPLRVVLPGKDKLIRPEEDPDLLLLRVDKAIGDNPLQAKTVWLFAKYLAAAFLVLGLAGFFLPTRSESAAKPA